MKLYTFGCSNTAPYHELTKGYRDYKKFRGGSFPPIWSELLAEKLNCELVNYAIPGSGNDSIFYEFCKHINEIEKDDLIIIGWTFIARYMWPDIKNKEWIHISGAYNSKIELTQSTHWQIIENRMNEEAIKMYTDQIYMWINLINRVSESVGFTVKYWSSDGNIIYPNSLSFPFKGLNSENVLVLRQYIFEYIKILGGEKISEETKGEVDDAHWGESGHQKVCEIFYTHIKNKLNFTKDLIL
jgi:hypothetical protein